MNNFEKVFLAIKANCEKQKSFAQINNFTTISKKAEVAPDKLPGYLSYLQDAGLIRYSITDNYIYLTAFGRTQTRLPVPVV